MASNGDVQVVRREHVPAKHIVRADDGKEHILGVLKEFRRNDALCDFMPKDARVAMAWVHLDPGQTLNCHEHPVDSMIIVVDGSVIGFGDMERTEIGGGDIILVPRGRRHGLTGSGANGFWGLSVQFDSRGLYEEESNPWARFVDESAPRSEARASSDPVDELLRRNEDYVGRFRTHRLFTVVERAGPGDATARKRFLDCFQVWSNYFQKMVHARFVFSDHKQFESLALAHLLEELGHNRELESIRESPSAVWDPVLESTCSWFTWKVLTLGDVEKVILVHLVVEASAAVFYEKMRPFMSEAKRHFEMHASLDSSHVDMGVSLLRRFPLGELSKPLAIQKQGWEMLHAMFGRIADLVTL